MSLYIVLFGHIYHLPRAPGVRHSGTEKSVAVTLLVGETDVAAHAARGPR